MNSSISFENRTPEYNSEQVAQQMSPLKSVETDSDEILQTQNKLSIENVGELQILMESPDVRKQMNKAYMYMNSKAFADNDR